MKIGNNGLKINTGLVQMQHKSNLVSQMLGGGSSIASLSSLMGTGSARTQAMSLMQQMDTFDRLSSLTTEDAGTYSASAARGTAREQAKELMKELESEEATAETAAETAAQTNGESRLSDRAQDCLAGLRKDFADTDFFVVDRDDDEAKLVGGSKKDYTVVLTRTEVERMANDKTYAARQREAIEASRTAPAAAAEEAEEKTED